MMAGLIKNAKKINVWAFCNQKKNRSLAHFTVFFSGWANMLSFGWSSRGRFINGGGALSGRSKPPQNDPFGDWYFFFCPKAQKRYYLGGINSQKNLKSQRKIRNEKMHLSLCLWPPVIAKPTPLQIRHATDLKRRTARFFATLGDNTSEVLGMGGINSLLEG